MFFLSHILGLFSNDCAVALTGDAFWFMGPGAETPVELPAWAAGVQEAEGFEYRYFGREALQMKGRTPEPLTLVPAMREGWPADTESAERLLAGGLQECTGGGAFSHPRVVATFRAAGDRDRSEAAGLLLRRAGARRIYVVPYPTACAIGMKLDMTEPHIQGVIAIERDWFAFAVIALSGVLHETDGPFGMDSMIGDIRCHLRDVCNVTHADDVLRRQLFSTGFSLVCESRGMADWLGRATADPAGESPPTADSLTVGASPTVARIAEAVKETALRLEPDALDELGAAGLHLCGEGAAIPGLSALLSRRSGFNVTPHTETPHPAILGLTTVLENLDTIGPALENL